MSIWKDMEGYARIQWSNLWLNCYACLLIWVAIKFHFNRNIVFPIYDLFYYACSFLMQWVCVVDSVLYISLLKIKDNEGWKWWCRERQRQRPWKRKGGCWSMYLFWSNDKKINFKTRTKEKESEEKKKGEKNHQKWQLLKQVQKKLSWKLQLKKRWRWNAVYVIYWFH